MECVVATLNPSLTLPHCAVFTPGRYGQCVANAECSSGYGGLCQCESGFYKNQGTCVPRVQTDEYCTGKGQCVDHAQCSSDFFGTCKCDPG